MIDRSTLKSAAELALNLLGEEHPIKHQPSKGARYVLRTRSGAMELMLEKNIDVPTNIWMHQDQAAGLIGKGVAHKLSSARKLYKVLGANGKLRYGRHSALEDMPELGTADLVYFIPKTFTELGVVLDYLVGL
ncbi:hypothetical protein [Ancylobacter amanitiformis]|uniref:Uncharacterized protein n=1 Tax=Ancylobacter amanitiformis TaxID=217069 RepID=A0ABU0LVF0_9HYPH|nr:hypothetical protein [Ancylobacter amanitiformis]MDQ0512645.1 hypothetical protein [Ancylobacter amanitiformis]